MTQDPHRSSWDPPGGEQPVEPSAGSTQPGGSPQAPQPAPPAHGGPPQQHGHSYGQGYGQYGQGYGQQPVYAPQGYAGVPASAAPRSAVPTPAIVLLVISGLLSLVLSWTVVGLAYLAPTVLGAVAVARGGSDPEGSRRMTRTGWIVFGVVTVVIGLLVVVGAVLLFSLRGGSGGGVPGGVSV